MEKSNMDIKVFEPMALGIVNSVENLDGTFVLEVNRNTKKDKETTYYDTIYSISGTALNYSDNGDLNVLDQKGEIIGHINNKALIKNSDVLSISINGEYVGGFDLNAHNEYIMELEEKREQLEQLINNLPPEERAEVNRLIEEKFGNKTEVGTGVTVKEDVE